MKYSNEYLEKSNQFAAAVESNPMLMAKMKEGNFDPLTPEEDKIITDWVESGDPKVWEFLEKFVKSDFLQSIVKNH